MLKVIRTIVFWVSAPFVVLFAVFIMLPLAAAHAIVKDWLVPGWRDR